MLLKMWNTLTKQQKIDALIDFSSCLKDKVMFGIITVTTGLLKNTDEADELFDDLIFIKNEGVSLNMIELQLKTELKAETNS